MSKNVPQPGCRTHQEYYRWAQSYVADFLKRAGHVPTAAEFRTASLAFFSRPGATG